MKLRGKIIIILVCISTGKTLPAEEYPDWEGYPPMNSMTDVIEFKGNVYGTSESGVFSYNPLTREYKLFYKNHGLPEDNALAIAATSNEIFIGFKNDGLMRFDPENEIFFAFHPENKAYCLLCRLCSADSCGERLFLL